MYCPACVKWGYFSNVKAHSRVNVLLGIWLGPRIKIQCIYNCHVNRLQSQPIIHINSCNILNRCFQIYRRRSRKTKVRGEPVVAVMDRQVNEIEVIVFPIGQKHLFYGALFIGFKSSLLCYWSDLQTGTKVRFPVLSWNIYWQWMVLGPPWPKSFEKLGRPLRRVSLSSWI